MLSSFFYSIVPLCEKDEKSEKNIYEVKTIVVILRIFHKYSKILRNGSCYLAAQISLHIQATSC